MKKKLLKPNFESKIRDDSIKRIMRLLSAFLLIFNLLPFTDSYSQNKAFDFHLKETQETAIANSTVTIQAKEVKTTPPPSFLKL